MLAWRAQAGTSRRDAQGVQGIATRLSRQQAGVANRVRKCSSASLFFFFKPYEKKNTRRDQSMEPGTERPVERFNERNRIEPDHNVRHQT